MEPDAWRFFQPCRERNVSSTMLRQISAKRSRAEKVYRSLGDDLAVSGNAIRHD